MSKKFLTSIDLHKNELQNAVVHSLVTAPASGTAGQIYYNSTDKKLYQHDGTSWVCVGTAYALGTGTPSSNTVPITLSADGQVQDTITIAGAGGATLSFSNGTLTITTADNNTTYTFTGAASSTAYVITCTPSSGSAQTVTIPLADGTNAGLMSPSEYTKLSGIESGAQKNVQGDFNQSDSTADDFIKNKPTITNYDTGTASDLSTGTSTTAKVWTPKVIHDHVAGVSPVQTNENTTPYQFRPTPQCGSIEYLDQVVGGTLAVNQLVQTTDTEVTITSGHKYLSKINDVQTVAQSDGTAIAINDGTKDNVFDLTQMFPPSIADYVYNLEQSTAGSGVAWLKQYYPKIFNGYQPYNAGTLESVEASAHVMTGFNQFDKNASGIQTNCYMTNTGTVRSGIAGSSVSDYIDIIGGQTYYFSQLVPNSVPRYCCWFNANKEFISSFQTLSVAGTKEAPTDARYIRLTYATSLLDTVCVNISSDRNGEYEAYTQTSYPLDSTLTLRGVPKLNNGVPYYDGDTYASDGSVNRRYTQVDFADFTFGNVTVGTSGSGVKYADVILAGVKANEIAISNKYEWILTSTTGADKTFKTYSNAFTIYDNRFTDAETAKSILASEATSIVYLKATPTTETADPYNRVQECYKGGTEEFVSGNVIPVGHTTYYPLTLKDTMPTSNGTYTLSLTVADGKPTLSWS